MSVPLLNLILEFGSRKAEVREGGLPIEICYAVGDGVPAEGLSLSHNFPYKPSFYAAEWGFDKEAGPEEGGIVDIGFLDGCNQIGIV
jgi:hypothetical protein